MAADKKPVDADGRYPQGVCRGKLYTTQGYVKRGDAQVCPSTQRPATATGLAAHREGQRDGDFRNNLPLVWLTSTFIRGPQCVEERGAGRPAPEETEPVLMMLSLLSSLEESAQP